MQDPLPKNKKPRRSKTFLAPHTTFYKECFKENVSQVKSIKEIQKPMQVAF